MDALHDRTEIFVFREFRKTMLPAGKGEDFSADYLLKGVPDIIVLLFSL